jgi:hypothetical protein
MLAPQSGQIRLRIEEIKLGLVLISANETIMYLPVVAVLHRCRQRILSEGPQELLGKVPLDAVRPLSSDSRIRATELPKRLAKYERSNSPQEIDGSSSPEETGATKISRRSVIGVEKRFLDQSVRVQSSTKAFATLTETSQPLTPEPVVHMWCDKSDPQRVTDFSGSHSDDINELSRAM